jgi:hypothetical protein
MTKTLRLLILGILTIITLSGCSPIVKAEQPAVLDFIELDISGSLGQTFVPRFDGLNGIELYLEPDQPGDGTLQLSLHRGPQDPSNFGLATMPLESISAPGYYRFTLPVQRESNQQSYYLHLKTKGIGSVKVGTAPGNYYLNGVLYQNGQPVDHLQAAFNLTYNPRQMFSGVFREGITWIGYILLSIYLCVIPGWVILSVLATPKIRSAPWMVKIGLAIGISVSIYPLLILWTDVIGLHLGAVYAWLPGAIGLVYLIVIGFSNSRNTTAWLKEGWKAAKQNLGSSLVLVVILTLIFATRFWAIRSIPVPLWGDSYHHTIITQLLLDNKGLFQSWQPYAELTTFSYHFGFHSLAACFAWLTHIPSEKAVLFSGQIINALAVISLYPLAWKITRSRWASMLTLLVAGLLFEVPMTYTNWGRYTQLAGQAILPAAIFLVWQSFEKKQINWKSILLINLTLAGLGLTHYRILLLVLIFLPTIWLFSLRKKSLRFLIKRTFWVGLGSLLLYVPWLLRTISGKMITIISAQVSQPEPAIVAAYNPSAMLGSVFGYVPAWTWLLGAPLLGWLFWKRDRKIAILSAWWFLISIAGNLGWLHIPDVIVLDYFAVAIAMYIPASILFGAGSNTLIQAARDSTWSSHLPVVSRKILTALGVIGLVALSVWGARQRLFDIDPIQYSLVTFPDLQAFEWIDDNTPEDARFLVNSFFAYNYYVLAGSDGGWWIPVLGHRETTLPPINYGLEQGPDSNYAAWVNEPWVEINENGLNQPETLAMLLDRGITHIYIGQQQGQVNHQGFQLNPSVLISNPNFKPVYHRDRVWIFEIRR